jgi:hypothetical protein
MTNELRDGMEYPDDDDHTVNLQCIECGWSDWFTSESCNGGSSCREGYCEECDDMQIFVIVN